MNLNKAFVLGNVTKDPESRALPSGQQVVSFGIATNRFYTDQAGVKKQDAEFHNIVVFGKLADIASRYLTKGALVLIEGRIKNSSWDDKTTGVKRYKSEIIGESLQLGPRPTGAGAPSNTVGYSKPQSIGSNMPKAEEIPIIEENAPITNFVSQAEPQGDENNEIDVKDIPF